MIHAVMRVVIKYVFGSCMFVEFVVPPVASCAFMCAGILVAILKLFLFDSGHLTSIVIGSERLLAFGEEKKRMQRCRWVREFSRWIRIS